MGFFPFDTSLQPLSHLPLLKVVLGDTDTVGSPVLSQLRYSRICQVLDAELSNYPRASMITGAMVVNISPCLTAQCGVEVVNPVMAPIACWAKLGALGQLSNAFVDGLSFDAAVSVDFARVHDPSEVAGAPDILLAPGLVTGNVLARDLDYLAESCLVGVSWVMLSQLFSRGGPCPLGHDYYRLSTPSTLFHIVRMDFEKVIRKR